MHVPNTCCECSSTHVKHTYVVYTRNKFFAGGPTVRVFWRMLAHAKPCNQSFLECLIITLCIHDTHQSIMVFRAFVEITVGLVCCSCVHSVHPARWSISNFLLFFFFTFFVCCCCCTVIFFLHSLSLFLFIFLFLTNAFQLLNLLTLTCVLRQKFQLLRSVDVIITY